MNIVSRWNSSIKKMYNWADKMKLFYVECMQKHGKNIVVMKKGLSWEVGSVFWSNLSFLGMSQVFR